MKDDCIERDMFWFTFGGLRIVLLSVLIVIGIVWLIIALFT